MIDALIKLYCDQPLSEAALARLAERVGRMDEKDPMTSALGDNLVSYFTLQKGDSPRARRFGERAIRHFRQADGLFGEMHLYAHIGQAEMATGALAAAEASYRTMRDLCRERLGEGSDLEAIASVLAAEARCLADDRVAARRLLWPRARPHRGSRRLVRRLRRRRARARHRQTARDAPPRRVA